MLVIKMSSEHDFMYRCKTKIRINRVKLVSNQFIAIQLQPLLIYL